MGVVSGQVIRDTGEPRVHITATKLLGGNFLARRRLHQRRTGEKNRSLVLDDNRFIGHGRHVSAACRARAHHHGDLRNAFRRHVGLIVKDASEMVAVGKHFVLVGQICAAGIHQINARKFILFGNLLGAQMLFDRDRIIGAAFDRGIIADDHHLLAGDPPDPGNHARRWRRAIIHVMSREHPDLKEGRARVQQLADPFAGQDFSAA
ncbi:hypothetical protein MnTg02_00326 [bacterium MnTg02]|nr:hypothetical protein MnTg02_00326 [bacterium MnTg02]